MTTGGVLLLSAGIVTAFAYCPAFAAGAAIYLTRWRPSGSLALASLSAFASLVLIIFLLPEMHWLLLGKDYLPWWFDLVQMLICAPLVPFVAWNVGQPSSPRDRHLGNLSFPFYLVHYPVVAASAGLTALPLVDKAAAFALACVAALALYVFVDRRFERLRKAVLPPTRGHFDGGCA